MDQADQAGHSHVLDIASLEQELEWDMNALSSQTSTVQLGGGSRPRLIISKVNNLTRNVDESKYDPHYVSIGPYHWSRSDSSLARKADKIGCLKDVLRANSSSVRVRDILCELENLEGSARSWYGDDFHMTRTEFVRMLLLDGCYILVRFGCVNVSDGNGAPMANGLVQEGDNTAPPVAAAGGDTDKLEDVGCVKVSDGNGAPMANGLVQEGDNTAPPVAAAGGDTDKLEDVAVVRDVFYLVENQIPFFVLDKILSTTGGNASAAINIAAYARELLEGQRYVAATPEVVALAESGVSGHLLHLLHLHFKPSATGGTSATGPPVGRWRTATEYYLAGVTLKKRAVSTKEARCILDVRLDKRGGTLQVPCLDMDSETWRILRNLTALEQHNPVVGSHVTAYCIFMSQVACNPQDVELLSMKGIIVHQMGNHGEVAGHFANLCKGVVFEANDPRCNYLRETCQALEKRFRSRRGRWMAWLRRKYFSNPWLVVGLVAAAIGLACAVVQTVYSVLSYYKGRN